MDFREGVQSLRKLGLGEPEAKVYASLYELGPSTAERISQFTGIHRRSVYDALALLSSEGLVTTAFIEGQKRFTATGVAALLAWIEESRSKAEAFLKTQEKKQQQQVPKPTVRVFAGKDAMKAVWMETLESGKEILWYAGAMQGARGVHKEFYPFWDAKRVRRKIPVRFIFIDLTEVKEFIKNERYFEARSIPKSQYTNAPLWLYEDKMVIVFWREEPLAIVIEDKDLAKTY
ncbi:MAG TPA: helix-turn-helix domain-containing protein, partial [Candidatus Norongarragalinales archaeon]|nr:helix-turn-helix domain-containing protein [Candidatus Norongarragalinales archaeon]